MHLSESLPVSGVTTRKYRPLPPRPLLQQQGRDYTAYSGDYRNRTSGVSRLSSTSTDSARRSNGSPTKAAPQSESENILDHIPSPNGGVANQTIFQGQWKRLSFIGKGSYGQVYRALDATTGDIFAVKEVGSRMKRRTKLVQALQDERETLKELEHPNIVHYLGFEEVQGALNIFLEYVPGGTIRSCLNTHGKFKEEVAKCFASQILEGLSYLHSKSILHRDLKSENILVEPRGICKISDFGISKKALETNGRRLYSTMKGTVAYMAPEMICNKKNGYDSKIDVWSVGCIVFEMWTSKTPWSGRQEMQILMKIYKEKIPPPLPDDVSLSTTAESFRQESFQFDPDKRPPAVKLLQHPYLKLPPQWAFPGVDKMGQASDTCSTSISLSRPPHVSPSHNDIGTGTDHLIKVREEQDSLYDSIYSDLNAISAEFNLSTANRARKSPSPARTMYSDVMDPRSPSPPLIYVTPPLRPTKKRSLPNNLVARTATSTSPNTSSRKSPLNGSRFVIHNTGSDDTEDARETTSPDYSGRRPYVYHPPPLPELSPYSHGLIIPMSINFGRPISEAFSKPINLSKPSSPKIPANHYISTKSSMDAISVSSSVARPNLGKVDYFVGQPGAPCMPSESDDDDDDDDDSYSPSVWKRPPVDIPSRLCQPVEPVEPVSDRNIPPIHHHHRPLPSAIPRPSVQTVYKDFLSENVENIDLPDTDIPRTPSSTKSRHTLKSIREVVEERLYQAQIGPAPSPRRAHFWDSHMEEIKN